MSTQRLTSLLLLFLASLTLLTTCRGKTNEPVSFHGWDVFDIPTLDPQIAEDKTSVDYIENLFVQLTNFDLQTTQVVPEAATQWEISADGQRYTFHLRTDIPWVKHDPLTGKTSQELDPQGNPRFLTAHDFVYAIQRACDPNTGSHYSAVVAPLLKGCSDLLFTPDPDHIPPQLWQALGVHAPNDDTLIIELEFPAGYFLSMTPLWTLAAVPHWTIETHGKDWIEASNIVTNGRFVLHAWEHDARRSLLRNPLLPQDMQGDGNIQRFEIDVLPDPHDGYALWLDGQVDSSWIPDDKLQSHLQQFPDETDQIADLGVTYIGFRMSKPPFDDPRVRRAFSAAFDRETYVDETLQGQGLPMIHFAPPGIFGAPPIDQVGLGFDPEFARQQLAEAGYPDCQGFPPVTLVGYSVKTTLIEYAKTQWTKHLGCSTDRIQIEQLPFREMLSIIEAQTPDAQAPHMWTLAWGPDYPDENNWVGDVLWCQGANPHKRTCNQIDDLIVQARQEPNPQRRIQLYRQIEDSFFGPEGEIPFFPISVRIAFTARHAWLDRTPALFGGQQWYHWTIDQPAQLAAQH